MQKFILILHTLMETVNSEDSQEQTDGVITDAILQIVIKISVLLKKNIDSLNLPSILKNTLKKINLIIQTDQNAENSNETKTTSETSRDGVKEQ